MKLRRTWAVIAAGLAALVFAPTPSHAFPENTETRGELPMNLNGVWMVVNQIVYGNATPAPGEPTPAATPEAAAAPAKERVLNAVQLLRIVHVTKDLAEKTRENDVKLAAASVEKAKAILAKEKKPDGKVIVPIVPTRPDAPPPAHGDELEVYLLDLQLPKSVEESLQKAQDAQITWKPTEKDLATMKADWKTLKPVGRDEYTKIQWKVTAASEFDDQLKQDQSLTDAKFAIVSNQDMVPKPTQPKNNILVYGAENVTPDHIWGKHVRAMMASAPFPIPIELKGRYDMYKIDDLPQGGNKPKSAAAPK